MRVLLGLVVALMLAAGSASAASLGWVLNKNGGGSAHGTADIGAFDASVLLFGKGCGKARCPADSVHRLTAPHGAAALEVSGFWSYLSLDKRGAAFDPFGFMVNGVKTQLSDDSGPAAQAGSFGFLAMPGDAFGWYVSSVDTKHGAAIASVAADIAPVPLPASTLLLIGALGGLGLIRRRAAA